MRWYWYGVVLVIIEMFGILPELALVFEVF